ncbi:MAG: nucleoside permease [Planctomycetia bacterium]|nr:nucleoside permease [Planctomycetia bacterium]
MGIRVRLSLMMFLQYFVWGAWFVTLGGYIGGNTDQGRDLFEPGFTGVAYGTAAIGGMIAPFFVGMIADRFFSSERMLGLLHLAGAGLMYYLSTLTNQNLIYYVLIGYFICYMPTLALTNSLSFHHLTDPGRQFPGIRVLGTIGWILAGQFVGKHLKFVGQELQFVWDSTQGTTVEASTIPMLLAASGQALLGLYCFSLPHTPPQNRGAKVTIGDILGFESLKLLRRPAFAVFVLGSFLVAIPLQFYYNYTNFFLHSIGMENPADKMTWGQISEFFFMLLIPFFFARLGVKYMLLVGMACWGARYYLFANGNVDANMWMLYVGILLHGVCYDFFFVTGQMYVDREAEPRIRGAAQGFIAFVTLGIGSFIGSMLSSVVEKRVTTGGSIDWHAFWLYPAAGAIAVLVLFAIAFHDKSDKSVSAK